MSKSIETITAEELCTLSGLTDRRHRQLAASGYFPPPIKSQYQRDATIAGLFRWLREQADGRKGSRAVNQARATLLRAKAREVKSDAARFRGDMVPLDEAKRAVARMASAWRICFPEVADAVSAHFAGEERPKVAQTLRNTLQNAARRVSEAVLTYSDGKFKDDWFAKAWQAAISGGLVDSYELFEKEVQIWKEIIAMLAGENFETALADLRQMREEWPITERPKANENTTNETTK